MSKAEILDALPTLRPDERQEILDRLCDLQDAESRAVHQKLVNEAGKGLTYSMSDRAPE